MKKLIFILSSKKSKKYISISAILFILLALYLENVLGVKSLPEPIHIFFRLLSTFIKIILFCVIISAPVVGYMYLLKHTIPTKKEQNHYRRQLELEKISKPKINIIIKDYNEKGSFIQKIHRLKKLYEEKSLTKVEFEKAKNLLLS